MKRLLLVTILFNWVLLSADLNFGKDLFNDRLYEEAILEFEKVVAEAPTSDAAQEAIFLIGTSYMERNQYGRAENSFNKLVKGFPGNIFNDEVLHNLALAQFQQKKYMQVTETCEHLLTKYPLSQWTRSSLALYLQSFYELGEYNTVIVKADRFLRNYADDDNIPDVLLIQAKAYFASNIAEKGRETLQRITTEFKNFNAAWKAVELEVELEENAAGTAEAAELLAEKLEEDVPRTFEEPLRYKLALYYKQLELYDAAYSELRKLIEKFTSSLDLDKYILFYSDCQLKLNKADELIKDRINFKKVFRESPLKAEYLLKIARAYSMQNNTAKAKDLIADAQKATSDSKVLYKCDHLSADISLQEGKISQAIDQYKQLLENQFADQNDLLMKLGDIYYEKFSQYSTARKYYQRITTGYSEPQILAEAYYKIALCYEQQQKFNEAVDELSQVNLEDIASEEMKSKIKDRKNYLQKFKQKDFETAFSTLMQTLLTYSENGNKQQMQSDLVKIMAEDLKEYEATLKLLQNDNSLEGVYQKAKIFLKLVEKLKAESNTATLFTRIAELNELIAKLHKANKQAWVSELEIKKQLITAVDFDDSIASKLEKFIQDHAASSAANEFRFVLFEYYKKNDAAKAADFAEKLQADENVDQNDFNRAKAFLAEYYYAQDENDKALQNYELAEPYIDLFQPEMFFHYAVILNETGRTDAAVGKLDFLVNNAGNYEKYKDLVKYYSNLLRGKGEFAEAVKVQLYVSEDQRDDAFWQRLAEDYLQIDDRENAKLALMHVVEKDYQTLSKLGKLQYLTGDMEMAKYTFGELQDQNKSDLKNHEFLAKIAFQQEDFLTAAEEYKIIVDKLGNNFSDYQGIEQIALQNVIALYRIKNRPKAEALTKKFKKLFTPEQINDIELSRAIYHSQTNKKKAIKIFGNLIEGKNVSVSTRIEAYFWRGVAYLEKNELDKAVEDFSTVAGSVDLKMSNEAHLKLGTIKFSQEKYPESLEHYYKVIQNDKDGKLAFDAARNFAFVCKTIEEWQKAIAAYEIILERWGDQELEAATLFDIAFCHFRDKKYASAIEMFERAIPLLKENELKAEAQYWIGESYFGQESFETAVSEFLKVGYNYPEYAHWAASAELKAGEAYIEMDKLDKAKRIYQRIIEKYGRGSQWGSEAESRLQRM